ncbi:cytochrome d ubiquinol oxidase subunit II [Hyphomicrobium sp. LHD-15]|uniref:cytochrome d ubiquinol oxidase subunit II n=1 Tax=Hyphomicrobium sp. LHD-15 TaxID=3072142 RepID=UPI00280F0067|nr:cytochrome d ubiquinol oxidase subunit II [Hyphomicrobium sp. LHD-15]MDQ8698297.1 cytochrome d ubiquinol oxidase subunit II [Hyphomicrobium sp. LHD-15]
MDGLAYWLPLIWVSVLGIAVALYVVLDGFDLGIGILFPANPREADRDQMMNSVAPFWDGNETWLVLGGGGLFVAFPLAYSIIMPAVYLPVLIMLLALVFRGVAFEFRWVAKPHHQMWDIAFAGGSIVASFMQGLILGALLEGITVSNGAFSGGTFDWLSPFSLLTGLAVVAGYGLIGATWLVMKTDGDVQARARDHAKLLLPIVLTALLIVSLWTPIAVPRIFERWFTLPNFLLLAPVPLLTAYAAWSCWSGLATRHDTKPFVATIALFLLGFVGLAVSNLPYLVPPSLDVWQAAAHPSSQLFMLIGVLIFVPVILAYTVFVYWTFRGKVKAGEGYH